MRRNRFWSLIIWMFLIERGWKKKSISLEDLCLTTKTIDVFTLEKRNAILNCKITNPLTQKIEEELEFQMDMLAWLDNNKEWFFRGAGVSLLAGAGYLIKRYLLADYPYLSIKNTFRFKMSENVPSGVKGYNIRPKILFRSIEKANPFLAEKICESYIGLEVSWVLYFYSIEKADTGHSITFKVGKKENYFVSCTLDIENYPAFKIMQKGCKVLITGVISKVDFPLIYLGDCEIRY